MFYSGAITCFVYPSANWTLLLQERTGHLVAQPVESHLNPNFFSLSLFFCFDRHFEFSRGLPLYTCSQGAIHSTKISGNFGPKLNGSVRSNRKSFEKTGPPFEVVLFSRSDRLEFWLNGSRPQTPVAGSPFPVSRSPFRVLVTSSVLGVYTC